MPTLIDTDYKEMYSGEYTADDVTDTIDEGDCLSDEWLLSCCWWDWVVIDVEWLP